MIASRPVPLVGESLTISKGTPVATVGPPIGVRRFMPLGDSLTDGTGDPPNGGYRGPLFAQFPTLISVGSLTVNGGNHEGHTGFSSQDILTNISTYLALNPPDGVLLMIGTNDADAGTAASTTAANIVSTINIIIAANAATQVFIATIPNEDSTRTTENANAVLQRAAVTSAIASNFGSNPNVILVTMPTNIPDADLILGGEHPNQAGNVFVTAAWAAAIQATADTLPGALAITAGHVAPAISPPLVGAGMTMGQGTLGLSRTVATTGQSIALSEGQPSISAALAGSGITIAEGTPVPAVSPPTVGQSLTLTEGTAAPATSPPIVGLSVVTQEGTIVPATSPALAGSALTTAEGQPVAAVSPPLGGAGVTIGQGAVSPTIPGQAQLAGQAITARVGTTVPGISPAVTSLALVLSEGVLVAALSPAAAGAAIAATPGSMQPSSSPALPGASISTALGLPVANLSPTLLGGSLTFQEGAVTVQSFGPSAALSGLGMAMTGGMFGVAERTLGLVGLSMGMKGGAITTSDLPAVIRRMGTGPLRARHRKDPTNG